VIGRSAGGSSASVAPTRSAPTKSVARPSPDATANFGRASTPDSSTSSALENHELDPAGSPRAHDPIRYRSLTTDECGNQDAWVAR